MQMGQGYKKHLDLMFQHQDRTGGGRTPAAVELLARRRRKETSKEKHAGSTMSTTDSEQPCSPKESYAPKSLEVGLKIGLESSSKSSTGMECVEALDGTKTSEVVMESLLKSLEEPVKNKRKAQKKTKTKTHQKEKPPEESLQTQASQEVIETEAVEKTTLVGVDSAEAYPEAVLKVSSTSSTKEPEKQAERADRAEQPKPVDDSAQSEDEEWLTVPKLRGKRKLPKNPQVEEKKVASTTTKSEAKTTAKLNKNEKQVEEKSGSYKAAAEESIGVKTPPTTDEAKENARSPMHGGVSPKGNRMWSDICAEDNLPEENFPEDQFHVEADLSESIAEVVDAPERSEVITDAQSTFLKGKTEPKVKNSDVDALHPLPQRQAKIVKAEQPPSTLTPSEREILKLEKKYREMERLRQRQSDGETLNQNQLEKLFKAEEIHDKIQELRRQKEMEQLPLPEPEVEQAERAESHSHMSQSEPESEFGSEAVLWEEYAAEIQRLRSREVQMQMSGVEFVTSPHHVPYVDMEGSRVFFLTSLAQVFFF
jgi:hypothetical protein